MSRYFKHGVQLLAWLGLCIVSITRVSLHAGHSPHRVAWVWVEATLFGVLFVTYGYEFWNARRN
jgi:hypothetical protein